MPLYVPPPPEVARPKANESRPKKPVEVHFIVSTDTAKADPDTRKLIRSHVMLGKNLGRPRPDRKKKKPQAAEEPPKEKAQDGSIKEWAKLLKDDWEHNTSWLPMEASARQWNESLPPKVGNDLQFAQFAGYISPAIVHEIIGFSKKSKKILFPLEPCIDFNHRDRQWWDALTVDPAYLNTTAFMAYAYVNLMKGIRVGPMQNEAVFHFVETVRILRERLLMTDKRLLMSDSTIFIILSLAMYAHIIGDSATGRHHMKGLRRIVDLRGGINSFRHNQKLLMEVLRSDLGIALHSGSKPVFFVDNPFLEPLYPYPDNQEFLEAPRLKHRDGEKFLNHINDTLAEAWTFLKGFCYLINTSYSSHRRLPQHVLHEGMTSTMYRLMVMKFPQGSIDEALRLGLLTFSSYIFLRWQSVTLAYVHLPTIYKAALMDLKLSDEFPPQVILWLLMVGAISIFGEADDVWLKPWIKVNLELCEVERWEDLRSVLGVLMWVGISGDEAAERVYNECVGPRSGRVREEGSSSPID